MTGESAGTNGAKIRLGRPRTDGRPLEREPRAEIVAVASQLFARRGVGATTMSEIATASGLRQSSVYYYFRDKEAILEEILGTVNRVVLDHLGAVNAEGGPIALRLYRVVRADARQICSFPYDINEVYRISALQHERFGDFWSDRQQLNDELAALIRDGISAGELINVDPQLAALTLLSSDEGTQNWFRAKGTFGQRGGEDYDADTIGTFLADLALGALLSKRGRLAALRRTARLRDP
jgi:TetR/AcrR family transcriptional regulator